MKRRSHVKAGKGRGDSVVFRARGKREQEKILVGRMIALYCRKNHGSRGDLCPSCAELADYARQRSDRCPFMETKTFCSNCSVHCYRPDMRERIREVMRFSGPRMVFRCPIAVLRHLIAEKREKRRLASRVAPDGRGFSSKPRGFGRESEGEG